MNDWGKHFSYEINGFIRDLETERGDKEVQSVGRCADGTLI